MALVAPSIGMLMESVPAVNQPLIQMAGEKFDTFLSKDRSYPELTHLLGVASSAQPSVSGTSDLDYPSLAAPSVGLSELPLLTPIRQSPLPPELVEQYAHMQSNCMMGVFPEINRAWLTIDTDIFLWNYDDGSDLAYFDGLSDTIISAGLVLPKPNIFQNHIRFLLCLATPVEIILLGVSFTRPHEDVDINDFGGSEMHLLPDPLFSIPSDNVNVLSIKAANNGRIFMAAKDGCLYELVYQARDGWFSRKCRKVNHSSRSLSFLVPSFLTFSTEDPIVQMDVDDTRHIIYTRSEKGTLEVYDLGPDGQSMSRAAYLTKPSILHQAIQTARTIDRTNFHEIVHIAAIKSNESRYIHLVAITHSGVRLYFSTNHFDNFTYKSAHRPSTLALVHVRLPPGFSPNASAQRPTKVHAAHYSKGSTLLCTGQAEGSFSLWCLSPDAFPFQANLMETQVNYPIDTFTWVIAEVKARPSIDYAVETSRGTRQLLAPEPNPPAVVEQHTQSSSKYILLSSQGSYVVTRLRPVDQLRQLMLNNSGPDCREVENFFRLHKDDQACATCLILICSQDSTDAQTSEWASQAFFAFGGEARLRLGLDQTPAANLGPAFGSTTPVVGPGHTSMVGSPGPFSHSMRPTVASTPFSGGQRPDGQFFPEDSDAVLYSGRFRGLSLYFARIVRFMWENKLTLDVVMQGYGPQQHKVLDLAFERSELSWVLEEVKALKAFMEKHSQLSAVVESFQLATPGIVQASYARPDSVLGGRPSSQLQREQDQRLKEEAEILEREALVAIFHLISRTSECLALLQLLCYHQFHVVTSNLPRELQDQLRAMTLRDLVLHGADTCNIMINALINRYIGDNSTTDAISSKLRDLCPSLYSRDDAIATKATELLQAAMSAETRSNKEEMLQEAQELFKQVNQQLNLPAICQEFHQARFYDGVVDLCLAAAVKQDPSNLALHYYKNGKPPSDHQGMQAFSARYECYKSITDILDELLTTSTAATASPVPARPGPPLSPDPHRLTREEAERYLEDMMRKCLSSDDELFHVALYDWLIDTGLKERLLEISSPFVEPYLQRATQYEPDDLQMMDLLWMFYDKSRNFPSASRILSKLAERRTIDLTLQQRIEYLSRAVMCAKSSSLRTSSASEGEFLYDLEEKLEVARLQLQVFEAITRNHDISDPQVRDAVTQLNAELMDITRLYGDFADRFDLSECKLAIVFSAGHSDLELVQSLWKEILDKEFEGTAGKPPASRSTIISNKLISQGKIYITSERYFPLEFLVSYLEKKNCQFELNPQWVFQSFLDIGISLQKLHLVYDRLFKAKNPSWQTSRNPFHLLGAISELLEKFCQRPAHVSGLERRQFVTLCLDAIAGYKVELEATTGRPQVKRRLLEKFAELQYRLERMLRNP
ncbi:nuclear pore complex protein Nup155-like [Apostichopus japonicus]|uniref:nuclear pore complex protein Nup155-like n=1 Tax=Stichopus japonicus TaxID=307972 RepID=UPI003AB882FD